ncbi:MAG: flavodoxin family protein [Anaerovoracaceae bacterium]|nr:flavodoxin family protein [Anaerovoracaceae bacterium]
MNKKIVILNGSPRKNGNTSALTASFTEGAKSAGCDVTEFFLSGMDIRGCLGCFGGRSGRDCPCVQNDDMAKIYPKIKEADVVVLASPLYYWSVSGQLKTAVDRLFALEEGGGQALRGNGKSGILIMAAEGDGFEDSLSYFDHLMDHLEWNNLGAVLAGGNLEAGDIEGKPELEKARSLGESIK